MPKVDQNRQTKRKLKDHEKESVGNEVRNPKRRRMAKSSHAYKAGSVRNPKRNSEPGCPAAFLQLPIDIFLEIARDLTSGDLLNIARSAKSCHKLLMSRESKPIWRAAIGRVGLPHCPDDMSEPQYADLLYCQGCMFCTASRAKNVYFAFRLRLCKKCFKKHSKTGRRLISQYAPKLHGDEGRTVFKMMAYYLDCECFSSEAQAQWDVEEGLAAFWKDEFLEILDEYSSLRGEMKVKYVRERMADAAKINKHAKLVHNWMEDEETRKWEEKEESEREDIGRKRCARIYAKLLALGYGYNDLSGDDIDWYKLMEAAKKVTERTWTIMKSKLEQLIKEEDSMGLVG